MELKRSRAVVRVAGASTDNATRADTAVALARTRIFIRWAPLPGNATTKASPATVSSQKERSKGTRHEPALRTIAATRIARQRSDRMVPKASAAKHREIAE